jgi:hypothetical protein
MFRGLVAHHSKTISADIRLADVIAEDDEHVGFLGLCVHVRRLRDGEENGDRTAGREVDNVANSSDFGKTDITRHCITSFKIEQKLSLIKPGVPGPTYCSASFSISSAEPFQSTGSQLSSGLYSFRAAAVSDVCGPRSF